MDFSLKSNNPTPTGGKTKTSYLKVAAIRMAATSYLKYVKLMNVLSNLWLDMYMYERLGSPITSIFPYCVSIFRIQ